VGNEEQVRELEHLITFRRDGTVSDEPVAGLGTLPPSAPPPLVDRGSRAETVAYGGGLRASSKRIVLALVVAGLLVGLLGATVYLVNAADANSYSAAVVPANVTELNFSLELPLKDILVSPGERVTAGQVLAVQTDPALVDALAAAGLAVKAATDRLAHLRATIGPALRHPDPSQAWALASARLALAEARVHLAFERATVAALSLRAPVAGTVLRVDGTPGQIVGPDGLRSSALTDPSIPTAQVFQLFPGASGSSAALSANSAVVTLVRGRRWEVIARVPESAVAGVHVGGSATFQFSDLSAPPQPCTISRVLPDPIVSGGTVDYEVVLLLRSKAPAGVLPGMSGVAKLG